MRTVKYLIRSIIGGALTLASVIANAQQALPANYSGNVPLNYVRTFDVKAPESNTSNLLTKPVKDVQMTTQYFDGLGRPLQNVLKQGSLITDPNSPLSAANAVDLVNGIVYDEFGREQFKYLPSPASAIGNNSHISDGLFKQNPFQQQEAFYSDYLNTQTGEVNTSKNWAYGQTFFEISPLSRPIETFAPGVSWVGTATQLLEGHRKSTKIKYWTNTSTDDVKIWKVTISGGSDITSSNPVQISITDNGNGTQTVTYSWVYIPNSTAVSLMYRDSPSSAWISNTGSPYGPRTYVMPTGNYEYALRVFFGANPTQVIMANSVSGDPVTAIPVSSCSVIGIYTSGELQKNVAIDENGKQVIEFKDDDGKVILKKVQLTATTDNGNGSDYTGWLCTYYIYDDLGNLRFVVQPEGVKQLKAENWPSLDAITSPAIWNEQCFRYEYDGKGRMVIKKVPGAGEVYMVYDANDRLIMSQDANMRVNNKWLIMLYDELNRPIESGLVLNTFPSGTAPGKTFGEHFVDAYNSTSYPFTVTGVPSASYYEKLSETHYDDYSGLPSPLSNTYINTWDGNFAATDNSNWPYPQMPEQTGNIHGLVTWVATKVLGTANTFLYTASIYDNKGRVIQVQATNEKGGTDVITTQYNWVGQPLAMVQKQQITGANAQVTTVVSQLSYDELGRLVKTEKKAANTLVNGGGMPSVATTIHQNEYDALGQLKKKSLGRQKDVNGNYTASPIETLTYDYNIRGWMLGTNRAYTRDAAGTTNNYFGFDLGYDKISNNLINNQTYAAAQYNGNISGMVWKSKGDGEKRMYDFTYDAANRLLKGDFSQYTGGSFNQNAGVNYNVKMGDGSNPELAYDANGNIKRMQQWGLTVTGSQQIDDLNYDYYTGTNRLRTVVDAYNQADTKLGDFRTSMLHPQSGIKTVPNITNIIDYTYDANGNLVRDYNKDIGNNSNEGVQYNHLNLPQVITVRKTGGGVKGTITYTYDAAGNKLKKTTEEAGASVSHNGTPFITDITTTTSYIGGMVFESKAYNNTNLSTLNYTDKLQFLGHEEGRIRLSAINNQPAFVFDYMLKDHLGNVRMVLTEEQKVDKYPVASLEDAKIATEDDYYTIDNSKVVAASSLSQLPPAYINDNGIGNNPADPAFETSNSVKLYKLNSNTNKTGLGITLKVMAGDRIDIHGTSYWYQNTGSSGPNVAPAVIELLSGLLGSPASAAGGKATASQLDAISGVNGPLGNFINQPDRDNSSYPQRPKAFINYIFLDEQFKMASGGFSAVKPTAGLKNSQQHFAELQNKIAPKNGYVYIYVSNESPVDVFFDNLQVVHTRGAILEETHYYPFGLTMNAISSKALNGIVENKYKYNKGTELQNKEFFDESGLELYATALRSLDPQIGRWWQVDSKPDYAQSLYSAMGNNPILKNDPLGDTTKIGDSRNQTLKSAVNGKSYSGSKLTKKLINEWETIGGVKLRVNKKTGEIEFRGYNSKSKFSQTGREKIMKMVTGNGQTTIDFTLGKSTQGEGGNISLNPSQIDKMVDGTSKDLNVLTMSYGLVTLHEYFHTSAGGDQRHNLGAMIFGDIDQPDIVGNKIRSEMSEATGANWGQRQSYKSLSIGGNSYTPMSFESLRRIASAASSQGTLEGFLHRPLPSSEVIIVPGGLNQ